MSTTPVANLPPVFATGVNDTGGKFAAGVNDAGGKLPPVSTTPAANLPPVSMTPVANNDNHYQTADNIKMNKSIDICLLCNVFVFQFLFSKKPIQKFCKEMLTKT